MPGSGLKPKKIRSVKKNAKKIKFIVDIKGVFMYNMSCVRDMTNIKKRQTLCSGVWLSLARALDLGSRGRRFESCHPDADLNTVKQYAGVVQW